MLTDLRGYGDSGRPDDVWLEHSHAPVEGRVLDCGHFLAEEQPDDVSSELLRFFDTED